MKKTSVKNKTRLVLFLSVVLVASMLFGTLALLKVDGASYYYGTDANMQKLENQLASIKKEISALQTKINSTKNNKSEAMQNKAYLDNQIKLTHDNIEVTLKLIEGLSEDIANKIAEIDEKQSEYDTKLDNFKKRLRINREEGEISYLDMLLGSSDLADFFGELDRIGAMIEYDNKVMETIVDEKKALEIQKEEYEASLSRQLELKAELEAAQLDLERQAEESANYINNLVANQAQYEKALKQKEEERAKIDKEIDDYAKLLAEQNTKYIGGEFMWPVPTKYTYVSSEYVWRNNPLYGNRELHNGIDIPVAFGTDIYASNSGTVVKSTWHNSYGYYVMIDHGGGFATLYAHNSKLLVSVGDYVERGQVIAKAGSTGDSTGNHCHFSMYENGATINPRKYFPK